MEFVIRLYSTILLLLPVVPLDVEKNNVPEDKAVDAPLILQYRITLLLAAFLKQIVDVVPRFEVLVLSIVKSIADPVALTLPSIVTLSAPFNSMSGAFMFPLIV